MMESRRLLRYFLAALAYRTQKFSCGHEREDAARAPLHGPLSDAMTHAN